MDADEVRLEAWNTKLLRGVLAISLVFAAFWLYDSAELHVGGIVDTVWQRAALPVWIMTVSWAPVSLVVALNLTDRRNFIYLPTIVLADFASVMCALRAVS